MTDLEATRESVQEISQRQQKLRDDAVENQLSSLTESASMLKLKIMDIMQEYASIRSLPTHILSELGTHASSLIEHCQNLVCERNEGGSTEPWGTSPEELAACQRQLRRGLVTLDAFVEFWDEMDDESAENTTTDEEEEEEEEEDEDDEDEELMQDVIK